MKTFLAIAGGVLLALSCVTASDARSRANRQAPTQTQIQTQTEPTYYYGEERARDNSCFQSVPALYGCSVNGG